ncbi:hypothetical protein ACWEP5_23485 [Nocardia niigatensis]
MPLDTWTFLLVVASCVVLVAGVRWSVGDDRFPASAEAGDPVLVAGGFELRRVPLQNRHRVHGRHRAG